MSEDPTSTATPAGETTPDTQSSDPPAVDEAAQAEDLEVLSAMANGTRYELLRRIATADDGVCVCVLHEAVDVSQSAVSQALSRLHAAGLVARRKEGSWRYYETTPRAETLLDTLDDLRGNDE